MSRPRAMPYSWWTQSCRGEAIERLFRDGRGARPGRRAANDGGFRAQAGERRRPHSGADGRPRAHRQGHPRFGLHVRICARGGIRRCRRRRAPDRPAADAGHRLHDAAIGVQFRRRHLSLPQWLRGQRHQVLRRQRQQVVGSSGEPDRAPAGQPRGDPGVAAPGKGGAHRPQPHPVSGVLRLDDPGRYDARGLQDRGGLRERRGLQGGAAGFRRSRGRDRADRLFPEWPQHQRRMRIHAHGAAAAHRAGGACARRHCARWRRRPGHDGGCPGALRGWRPAPVCACARAPRCRHSSKVRWSAR